MGERKKKSYDIHLRKESIRKKFSNFSVKTLLFFAPSCVCLLWVFFRRNLTTELILPWSYGMGLSKLKNNKTGRSIMELESLWPASMGNTPVCICKCESIYENNVASLGSCREKRKTIFKIKEHTWKAQRIKRFPRWP